MSPGVLLPITPFQLLSLDILVWQLLITSRPHLIKILVFAGFKYFVSTYPSYREMSEYVSVSCNWVSKLIEIGVDGNILIDYLFDFFFNRINKIYSFSVIRFLRKPFVGFIYAF